MCEEDSEDHEAVAKLFEINDSIHRTIERYKLFKKGDIEAANNIPQGTLGRSGAGVSQGPNNTLNLIDFGDPEPASQTAGSSQAPQQPAAAGNALEDDLLGLSLSGDTYGQQGSISLGGSNGSGTLLVVEASIHQLTFFSPRHVRNGSATIAKSIKPGHHRSLLSRTEANTIPNHVTHSVYLFTAPNTASAHTGSFRCSYIHTTPRLTFPIPTVSQAPTSGIRCC
jgi:hypothetical protein